MLTRQTPNDISSFYLSRALPEGGGSNVVNVMLVDFRGFDTLGEITVLVAVALTVFALLRRFALSLIKQDTSPGSIKKKRKRAAWNNDALETTLQFPSRAASTPHGSRGTLLPRERLHR